jgi:hypothetical protein
MATPYEIDIAMSQDTVEKLNSHGYKLFAFKGVQSSVPGAPVVWFKTTKFGKVTSVKWKEQYQGYTADADAISGGSVSANNAYDMDFDQTLDVTGGAGTGAVVNGGLPTALTIANQSGVPFTSGISQMVQQPDGTSVANPMCAFDLFGSATLQIAPIEQVLLMFATDTHDTGAVIYNAFTQGVLIDLTASNTRSVSFDIDAGWDWGNAGWGQSVTNGAPLAPLLISTPSSKALSLLSRNVRRDAVRRLSLVA